jgi:hypothetical protein
MNTRPVVPNQCHSQAIPDSCIAQQAGQLERRLDVETMEPQDFKSSNERHRRKRTVYHFAPLAHFVARFHSTAPFGRCVLWTQQAAGNRPKEIEQLMNIFIYKVLQQFHLIQIYRKIDVFNQACFPVKHQLLSWKWSQSAYRMSYTNDSLKMIDRSQVLSWGTGNQMLHAVRFRNAAIYPLTISLALLVEIFIFKFHPPGFSLC